MMYSRHKVLMFVKFSLFMQILLRALSSPPFGDYNVWWSLADSKYAGTALLVKKCCQPKKVSFSLDRTGIGVQHVNFVMKNSSIL